MPFDQKILIIRFSSIGDIVLTTSPLKTIRNAFPNAQISYLTLEHFMPLLEFHPDIDRLIPLSKNTTGTNLWNISDYIRKQNYSVIFDLHNSLRSNIITLRTIRPVLQLYKPRWNRFILFHFHKNLFLNDFTSRKMYHEHLGDIWQDGDEIPKTSLKVTNHEKNEALKFVGKDSFITVVPWCSLGSEAMVIGKIYRIDKENKYDSRFTWREKRQNMFPNC